MKDETKALLQTVADYLQARGAATRVELVGLFGEEGMRDALSYGEREGWLEYSKVLDRWMVAPQHKTWDQRPVDLRLADLLQPPGSNPDKAWKILEDLYGPDGARQWLQDFGEAYKSTCGDYVRASVIASCAAGAKERM